MRSNNNKRTRSRQSSKNSINQKYMIFDSNGAEIRVRGNAMQIYEKYLQMAKDIMSEDRFKAENYRQHAEHYYRVYQAAVQSDESRREERLNKTERQNSSKNHESSKPKETSKKEKDHQVDDVNIEAKSTQPAQKKAKKTEDSNSFPACDNESIAEVEVIDLSTPSTTSS